MNRTIELFCFVHHWNLYRWYQYSVILSVALLMCIYSSIFYQLMLVTVEWLGSNEFLDRQITVSCCRPNWCLYFARVNSYVPIKLILFMLPLTTTSEKMRHIWKWRRPSLQSSTIEMKSNMFVGPTKHQSNFRLCLPCGWVSGTCSLVTKGTVEI